MQIRICSRVITSTLVSMVSYSISYRLCQRIYPKENSMLTRNSKGIWQANNSSVSLQSTQLCLTFPVAFALSMQIYWAGDVNFKLPSGTCKTCSSKTINSTNYGNNKRQSTAKQPMAFLYKLTVHGPTRHAVIMPHLATDSTLATLQWSGIFVYVSAHQSTAFVTIRHTTRCGRERERERSCEMRVGKRRRTFDDPRRHDNVSVSLNRSYNFSAKCDNWFTSIDFGSFPTPPSPRSPTPKALLYTARHCLEAHLILIKGASDAKARTTSTTTCRPEGA